MYYIWEQVRKTISTRKYDQFKFLSIKIYKRKYNTNQIEIELRNSTQGIYYYRCMKPE